LYVFIRDSTIQSDIRRFCTAYKLEDFGSLSAVQTTCHPVRTPICPPFHPSGRPTDQASSVRTTCFPVWTFTVSRSYCSNLNPPERFSSSSGRLSVIDQLQILSKFNLREDYLNRPDDVDSRPDALLYKARIVIQISPSEYQLALVRTHVHQLSKLPIQLQPSGRAHIRYGNCVLKISRPDAHPPWSRLAKPYKEITCSGRATVLTTLSHRPDTVLKQERFLSEIFGKICRTVVCLDGPCPPSRRHPHISLQLPILYLSL
jgi:hypothetical protein